MSAQQELVHDAATSVAKFARWWWLWIVFGVLWIIASILIFQFDTGSIKTVAVVVGVMFLVAAFQAFVAAQLEKSGWKWLWYAFGVLFVVAGVVAMLNPAETVASFASVLGFLFLLFGIMWIIESFVSKDHDPLWWLTLISGILMLVLAFWAAGQFLLTKAFTLLVLVGVFAMIKGVTDLFKAFAIKRIHDDAARIADRTAA